MWVNSKESRNKGSLPEEKEEELNKTCIVRVSATEKQNNSRLFPFSLDSVGVPVVFFSHVQHFD